MSRLTLYYYRHIGGMRSESSPKFTFSGDSTEELLNRFDDAMAQHDETACYMLDGYNWALGRDNQSQYFKVVNMCGMREPLGVVFIVT